MANQLGISADGTISLTGLSYETAAGVVTYLNAATVTYSLKTAAEAAVSGGTGTLSYTAATNGNYQGSIESTVTSTLTAGTMYLLDVTVVEGTRNDFRRLEVYVGYRGGT